MRNTTVIGFAFVALLLVHTTLADDAYDREAALETSQAAIGGRLGDYAFRSDLPQADRFPSGDSFRFESS